MKRPAFIHQEQFDRYNVQSKQWTYEQFVKCQTYELNRNVRLRYKKVLKHLQEGYKPEHSQISVGIVTKAFGKYKVGDLLRLNGNTRDYIYTLYPELIPPHFTVSFCCLESQEDADNAYYSIDSISAAETTAEKLTGIQMKYNVEFNYTKFQKGQYNTALDNVLKFMVNKDRTPFKPENLEEKIAPFFPVLTYLDDLGLDDKKTSRLTANPLSVYILLALKYQNDPITKKRFELLFDNFKYGITEVNNSKEMDGVHYVYNILYHKEKDLAWGSSKFKEVLLLIYKILYCFDMFMKNEKLERLDDDVKLPSNRQLIQYFMTFSRSLSVPEVEVINS